MLWPLGIIQELSNCYDCINDKEQLGLLLAEMIVIAIGLKIHCGISAVHATLFYVAIIFSYLIFIGNVYLFFVVIIVVDQELADLLSHHSPK